MPSSVIVTDLRDRLSLAMAADAARLARRMDRARSPADWSRIAEDLTRSIDKAHARAQGKPRIAYPPPDAHLELRAHETVALAAAGGSGTLRWLIDGRPLHGTKWMPDGAGESRVAVVDEAGRSAAVTVRIVRRP